MRRTLAIGDKATGTNARVELYDEMRATPVTPDLEALWRRLGVRLDANGMQFDDDAPLAEVRRAISVRPSAS